MEREYEYLLHLMGAFLNKRTPHADENVNWTRLMELAQIHCVTGMVGYLCSRHPICPDPRQKAILRSAYLKTVMTFTRRGALAEKLEQELAAAGIDAVWMKGYVLRGYYPVPELRTFGDIDLVIRPEDRQRCHARMLELGYQVKNDWEPVYSYVGAEELYEIHTDIMEIDVSPETDCRPYFQQMWAYAKETAPHSYRFSPEFHFIYLVTHIAKHLHGSGAGARMYLDAAAFIRHFGGSVDWPRVRWELKKLSLWEFACVVLTAADRWFGVSCPMAYEPAEPEVMEAFTEYTMEAGVFGHYQREGALAELKQETSQNVTTRWKLLMQRTFPAAETIRTRYTYLQKCPWLLPVAWGHRLVKTRGGLRQHAEEAREILRTDSEEIRRQRRLMKNIGL